MARKTGRRYKGGSAARDFDLFSADLPFFAITPQLVKAHSVSDAKIRKEYSRLRAVASKRLQRMAGSSIATETVAQHPGGFPKLSKLQTREDTVKALIDVTNFLTAKRGSLSGIKRSNKQIVKGFRKKGVRLHGDELAQYGRFLNFVKKTFGLKGGQYTLKFVTDVWDEMKYKGKITKKDFAEKMRELEKTFKENAGDSENKIRKGLSQNAIRTATLSDFFSEEDLDARTLSGDRRRRRNR